jgi:hypothetical protein
MGRVRVPKESVNGTRRPWTRTAKIVAVAVALLAIASSAVAVVLFAQTLPKTPSGQTPVLTTTCSTLTQNGPTSLLTGMSGTVLYTCGTGAAFTALAASATPAFSLPAGAGSLSYVAHTSGTTCTAGTTLVSGSLTTFSAGSYDYCLSYPSYPSAGIASFTVQWSQA